ncbi:DUF6225 family protein [Streptacidiphilus jiangxiensis]|uniref:Uncharacterized protein n=1 Tax=Streptacidiphilus jiangxiensis TaxID=235985 RepID=A0A1H7NRM1_STRJI|nr:DUF6225 family protein [Streptacidiphilus jiangxiensis]SEL26152.1 hypothetical protein SAMN05414137_10744 [Streptacidiphilus jiangxiensis]
MTNLDDYERYEHTVPEWTVGELRAALADLPDDVPVRIAVPQELTSRGPDDERDARYVITGTSKADPNFETLIGEVDDVLILITDYPSDTYVRRINSTD